MTFEDCRCCPLPMSPVDARVDTSVISSWYYLGVVGIEDAGANRKLGHGVFVLEGVYETPALPKPLLCFLITTKWTNLPAMLFYRDMPTDPSAMWEPALSRNLWKGEPPNLFLCRSWLSQVFWWKMDRVCLIIDCCDEAVSRIFKHGLSTHPSTSPSP